MAMSPHHNHRFRVFCATTGLALTLTATGLAVAPSHPAQAKDPLPGTNTLVTGKSFQSLWDSLEAAVAKNRMGLVASASASAGAKAQGFDIPGNAVVMVFRNDYARRMLAASTPAGIEAPLRFYLTENADGTGTLTYRTPSAVFAPYGNDDIDAMAAELDAIFEHIARDAMAE
jgi:uncharacterized protein (DUF302 family)